MTPLRPETHAHLGWRAASGFGFARQIALVPLAATEIGRVAQVMPVAFRKRDTRWEAVAVMGPVAGANIYVGREGKWRASFVPAQLRVYPFCLDAAGELALWEEYRPERLAAEDVAPFFDGAGWSPRVEQTLKFLKAVQAGISTVAPTLDTLEAQGVLMPWDVPGIDTPQPEIALRGLYVLDPKALDRLAEEAILSLFRAGALRWLYAHLDSLHHAQRFKALAKAIVAPEIAAPRQPDKIEQAADILAAIAEDLGDAEL